MIRSAWRFYGVLALAGTGLLTLLLMRAGLSFGRGLLAYLAAVNLVTLALYGYDKLIAGSRWPRVPESLLHGLALLGGSPAALAGQRLFRHKTVKAGFRVIFWLIVGLQIGLALFVLGYGLLY